MKADARHFPDPPRVFVQVAGRPQAVRYMTRADVQALVAVLYELCGGVPEDMAMAFKAVSGNREAAVRLLCEAFPEAADVIPGLDEDVRTALLEIVWSANDVPLILEDLRDGADSDEEEPEDPLAWPKLLLILSSRFHVSPDEMLHRWSYWQFKAFLEAAGELAEGEAESQGAAGGSQGVPLEALVRNGFHGK